MLKVDRQNPTPLYEQIKLILREQITEGEFGPGVQLPTENQLCRQYAVSRITIVKALTDLQHEGLIRRIQGKGSIVNPLPIRTAMNNIMGFTESMRRNGLTPRSIVSMMETIDGDLELRQTFQLPMNYDGKFTRFRREMYVNDIPSVLFTVIVRQEIGSKLQAYPLNNTSFYKLYEKILGRRVIRNDTALTPILATPELTDFFQVKAGTPHFAFRGLSFVEGDVPVELSMGFYRGDMFQFESTIYRVREEVANKRIT
jgi:DNA-binding GntR family transcriptional regulator